MLSTLKYNKILFHFPKLCHVLAVLKWRKYKRKWWGKKDHTGFAWVLENLDSPGIFVEVLESPGIWRFIIINHYTSSQMPSLTTTHCTLLTHSVCVISLSIQCGAAFIENKGVYFLPLRVHEFIEKVLEFDLESSGIWGVKTCMNPDHMTSPPPTSNMHTDPSHEDEKCSLCMMIIIIIKFMTYGPQSLHNIGARLQL